jgi:hypothetical protein
MTIQRQQFRMPVSRSGLVTKAHTTTLCEITDITEKGLQFSTDLLLTENDTVRIECQLDAACIIQCELVVTHAETPCYGGRIMHLLPEHQQQLALFIQRLIISSMAGL